MFQSSALPELAHVLNTPSLSAASFSSSVVLAPPPFPSRLPLDRILEASLGPLGASWGPFGAERWSLRFVFPFFDLLGAIVNRLVRLLGRPEALLGRLGALLGASWAVLERFWEPLGRSWSVGKPKRRENAKTFQKPQENQ